jgi:hypothetical protein
MIQTGRSTIPIPNIPPILCSFISDMKEGMEKGGNILSLTRAFY